MVDNGAEELAELLAAGVANTESESSICAVADELTQRGAKLR